MCKKTYRCNVQKGTPLRRAMELEGGAVNGGAVHGGAPDAATANGGEVEGVDGSADASHPVAALPPEFFTPLESFDAVHHALSNLPDLSASYLAEQTAQTQGVLDAINGQLSARVMRSYGAFVHGIAQVRQLESRTTVILSPRPAPLPALLLSPRPAPLPALLTARLTAAWFNSLDRCNSSSRTSFSPPSSAALRGGTSAGCRAGWCMAV